MEIPVVCVLLAVVLVGVVVARTDEACAPCTTNRYARCSGTPCQCTLKISKSEAIPVNCSIMTRKCWMMKAEMYRIVNGVGTRRKPSEDALLDTDGIYDPECNDVGDFHAKQCNGTDVCWCVNSAGVRRTDKGDTDKKCDELVKTFWFRIELRHKPVDSIDENKLIEKITKVVEEYQVAKGYIEKVEYFKDDNTIILDLKQNITVQTPSDLATSAYYLEKEIKDSSFYTTPAGSRSIKADGIDVDGVKVTFTKALVYYVDERGPEFSMKQLTPGVIAVIVVVVLAIIAGLVVLVLSRKKMKSHMYQKAEGRELDEMQK
uniref:Epithelial cell adhesion molecule n=1 Tax=Callorhinchus milii TaxID=7868 RepID=K4FXS8_CALMI|nr:epithelial cell adhesion molecule [Callorhinchus milii]